MFKLHKTLPLQFQHLSPNLTSDPNQSLDNVETFAQYVNLEVSQTEINQIPYKSIMLPKNRQVLFLKGIAPKSKLNSKRLTLAPLNLQSSKQNSSLILSSQSVSPNTSALLDVNELPKQGSKEGNKTSRLTINSQQEIDYTQDLLLLNQTTQLQNEEEGQIRYLSLVIVKDCEQFIYLLLTKNSNYKSYLKSQKCFTIMNLESNQKVTFIQDIINFLKVNQQPNIFDYKQIPYDNGYEPTLNVKRIIKQVYHNQAPNYKYAYGIDFQLINLKAIKQNNNLVYLSQERLDVKLQIYLSIQVQHYVYVKNAVQEQGQVTQIVKQDSTTTYSLLSTQPSIVHTSQTYSDPKRLCHYQGSQIEDNSIKTEIIRNRLKSYSLDSEREIMPINKNKNKKLKCLMEQLNKQNLISKSDEVVMAIRQKHSINKKMQPLQDSYSVYEKIITIFLDKFKLNEQNLVDVKPQLLNTRVYFSQFLLLCEVSTNFCKNNRLVDTLLLKQENIRLEILVENVLFFRLSHLIAQYKFLQLVDHQVLKAVVRIMLNNYQLELTDDFNIHFFWIDYVRFKNLFFQEGQWNREDSILFILSVIEAGKTETVSGLSVAQIFRPHDVLIQIMKPNQKSIRRVDLLRIVISKLSEWDLFKVVQSLLKQQ